MMFKEVRNSHLQLNCVYFWTDTIKDWQNLLADDASKHIIIDSWSYLVKQGKIKIYGFIIMPNHIHVIWEPLSMNGKEMPHASFNKFTAHQFLKMIDGSASKKYYKVTDAARRYRFWQRDPLAVLMDSKQLVEQKLDYIHLNPLQEKWNLAEYPADYRWSSAQFYETGIDEFDILTHYMELF